MYDNDVMVAQAVQSPALKLPLGPANQLAAALAAYIAEREGIRALLIKGLVTSHYGLRDERVSADTDVLIDSAHVESFMAAMHRAGWRERPVTAGADALAAHSHELIHDDWPCDIDVHHAFPGLLAGPQQAFEALWQQRATMALAGRDCPIPDRDGALIISALHALRHVGNDERHAAELAGVTARLASLSHEERDQLATLAQDTGADGPLAELFAQHSVVVNPSPSDALVAWHTRRLAGEAFAGNVVAGLGQARWRERPRLAWLAMWPSERQLRAVHPDIEPGRAALRRARLARIRRGLRQLPTALAARRSARRSIPRTSARGHE